MARIDPHDGFGLPDLHWVDTTYLAPNTGGALTSDYSEAGSVPGRVTQVDGQTLVPVMSGGQGDETVNLRVNRSGYAGAAGVVYDLDGGTKRGWLTPRACGWESIDSDAIVTSTDDLHPVSSVVIPSTQKIVTAYANGSAGTVYTRTRSAAGVWSAQVDVTTDAADGLCLYITPDESRLILVRIATTGRIATYYSLDDGATWTVQGRATDSNVTLNAPGRCSGCFVGQDMLLVTSHMEQVASADQGITWSIVETDTGVNEPTVAAINGATTATVVYIDGSADIIARPIASAFQPLSTGRAVTVAATTVTACAAVQDYDGTLYALAWNVSGSAGDRTIYTSTDGLTWSSGTVTHDNAATYSSNRCGLVACRGSLWLIGTNVVDSNDTDSWVWAAKLTAWSSVEWDGTPAHTWVCLTQPDAGAGTPYALTGTAGSVGAADYMQIATTAAQGFYTYTGPGASLTTGAHFAMRTATAGDLASSVIAASLTSCDASDTYQLVVRFTSTGFRARDNISGATIADVTVDTTTNLELLMAFTAGGECFLAYKRETDSTWTEVAAVSAHSFTTLGAGASNWEFEFGHIASGTQTSRWKWVTVYNDIGGISQGNGMIGKKIGGLPYPLADVDDADGNVGFLSIRGGIGLNTQSYAIPPGYTYALRNALVAVAPGPRKGWRSTDTTQQIIAINLGGSEFSGGAFGIYFGRINFRTAVLEYHNGSSWVGVGTLDAATGMAELEYERTGGSIYPQSTATESGRIIQDSEYDDGGWVHLTDGVDDAARYVCDTSGGWWQSRSDTAAVIPVLNLRDIDDTEPTSGDATLVSSDAVLVVYPTTRIVAQRWRIRIPSQVCPDSYFTAGVIMPFRLHAFYQPWSWSASGEESSQYDSFRDAAGVESRSRRGDEVRSWTLGWPDGVSMTAARQEAGGRDRVGVSGGLPLEDEGTTLFQLRGFHKRTRGQTLPVVALAKLPTATGTITDRTLFLYGHLTSSTAHSLAQGWENETELLRLEGVRVDGIPG